MSNSSDGSSAQQCAHEPKGFNTGETKVYTCPCGLYGRYVRIRYPVNQRSFLYLCEVQIQSGGKQIIFHCHFCKVQEFSHAGCRSEMQNFNKNKCKHFLLSSKDFAVVLQ